MNYQFKCLLVRLFNTTINFYSSSYYNNADILKLWVSLSMDVGDGNNNSSDNNINKSVMTKINIQNLL